MISGVGIDIIEVCRIGKAFQKERFRCKIYTINELEYIASRKNAITTASGIFCAKEATAKAMGSGFRGLKFVDIEVLPNNLGKPEITLLNEKGKEYEGSHRFLCSISHTKEYAVAEVLLIINEENHI